MKYRKKELTAWCAGLFEGEGTITIGKTGRVRVAIHMTDYDVICALHINFGGHVYVAKKQKKHHKQSWVWHLGCQSSVEKFLLDIIPYLFCRRKQKAKQALSSIKRIRKYSALENQRILVRTNLLWRRVKELHSKNVPQKEIAKRLGKSRSHVCKIINGTGKHYVART